MSTVASNKCKELLTKKVIDFANDAFKMILMQPGFAFSRANHNVYADVIASEHAAGSGYTAGGEAMAGVTITKNDTLNQAIVTWNNVSWLAAGGDFAACGAIIYDDTVAAPVVDPVIGFIDFGEVITTYDGGTMTVANPTFVVA